jgi:hypothetical protein
MLIVIKEPITPDQDEFPSLSQIVRGEGSPELPHRTRSQKLAGQDLK